MSKRAIGWVLIVLGVFIAIPFAVVMKMSGFPLWPAIIIGIVLIKLGANLVRSKPGERE